MRLSNAYGFKRFLIKTLDDFVAEQDPREEKGYADWFEKLFYFAENRYEVPEHEWRGGKYGL